ncbi:hypothetical protein Desde_2344 [Desulfitobacterium dehalogenans ATCC 51507]|uniref:Uncharacterized protein n=1 Tax=Desulfitobacterium dehalogenans (strain ATCC 51507 / DSM 9161 / JW/IU-DC1) TaxID=756499 RepID=I4A9P7_DESDJ|nr:DUF6544 family protein [Desulfitobacterium dehalogenans]AFM00682.1 hypothetical protein Desde_2344 [Desulfitobacterium dehalogenans ATCC 51507]
MGKILLVILAIILIVFIVCAAVTAIAKIRFSQMVAKEVTQFYKGIEGAQGIVQLSDLEELPPSVQKWLLHSQVVGKERMIATRTKQDINLRLKADQSWMKGQVEQYFRMAEPGFIWYADIQMAPLLHISGRDKYIDGHGHMLIKVLSMVTLANGQGKEMDQGALLRYLAEMMWSPSAALNDYIHWQEINDTSAEATMSYEGVTASGVFTFNEQGEVLSFEAERYGEFDGEYRLETWACVIQEYQELNGINVPSQGDIIWKLDTGDFHWYHFKVKELEHNKPFRYEL